jgi:GAF domain-containing protein/multidrug resistance efflux pump
VSDREDLQKQAREKELEGLYSQLTQSAARLMVVHEASNILRSTHDPEELAKRLVDVIAEAVFAGSACVSSLAGDELKILASRGLDDHALDTLAVDEKEAAVWFEVSEGEEPRTREELAATIAFESEGEDELPEDGEDVEAGVIGENESAAAEDAASGELSEGGEEELEDPEALWESAEAGWDEDGSEGGGGPWSPAFELYLPLRVEDEVLGVLALGARVDARPYGPEETQLARSLSSHLSLALSHARLFAERGERIEQLSALLQISREITSTLDLERVLSTIAHMVGMVLPNLRTTVAMVAGSRVEIRASTDPQFKAKEAAHDPFLPVLQWAHGSGQAVNTHREMLEADDEMPGRDLLLPWLSREGGPRGLAVVPLKDDQGVLGLLAIETETDTEPLDPDHEELITILANQTTVAMRNAELYSRIPMISMFEPVFGKARRGARGTKLLVRGGIAAAVIAVGLLLPLPAWVTGTAMVRPADPVALRAATEGTIDDVFVAEGEHVEAGKELGRMRRDELEVSLEQARSDAQRATAEAAQARSIGDLATYRSRQAVLRECLERESFLQTELGRTSLTAPVEGVVLTADIEHRQGAHLKRGDVFLELADLSTLEVDISVPETKVEEVEVGRTARLKFHAQPGRTIRGQVARIAPRSDPDGTFRVTVRVDNRDGLLRPGMTGRAHLEVPRQPLFRSVFGPIVRYFRLKFWA